MANGVLGHSSGVGWASIFLVVALLIASCGWEPVARPVQPERLLEGSLRVGGALDGNNRYVLLARQLEGLERRSIFDLRTHKLCDLPAEVIGVSNPLSPPTDAKNQPTLLLPLSLGEPDAPELSFADEHCNVRGPFGRFSNKVNPIAVDDDQRTVVLVGDGMGTLSLVDPWRNEQRVIATGVAEFNELARPTSGARPVGTQALWIRAQGKLEARDLEGELLISLGSAVTSYTQALFDTVRVAYVDGGDLYEAAGPEFKPRRIAQDACNPIYSGTTLNMFKPCKEKQLVRIELSTGTVQEFEPGVIWSYTQSGFTFDYVLDDGKTLLFATPPNGTRVLVEPTMTRLQVLDASLVAGLTSDQQFGVWSPRTGFKRLFEGVRELTPFIDSRTSEFLWLMLDQVEGDIGRLSVLNQSNFTRETVAEGVPLTGYAIDVLIGVPEPIVVLLEDASPIEGASQRFRGTLQARLLSGELASRIDADVSSFVLIKAPLAGLLYGVEDGPQQGLWFAAL